MRRPSPDADPDALRREWSDFAEEWIERSETDGDAARVGVLDDAMLGLLGDVAGLRVIDLGCGEGRFCRMLAERGATTLGVDLQPAFVEHARSRASAAETYRIGDIQRLDDVDDGAFDLAISYISLVDVPDQAAVMRAARRVLGPGGRFVVCNLSPMATAAGLDHETGIWSPWVRDDAGRKVHYVLDDYTHEGPRRIVFPSGAALTNFHRTMSTTVNDLLAAGFELRGLHEPVPDADQLARVPDNADLHRVPIFTIYDLRVRPD